jgi:hypothetical protein
MTTVLSGTLSADAVIACSMPHADWNTANKPLTKTTAAAITDAIFFFMFNLLNRLFYFYQPESVPAFHLTGCSAVIRCCRFCPDSRA